MPLARIDEVVDAVVAVIAADWSPSAPDSVSAEDAPEFNTDPDEGEVMSGRQVRVLPDSYDSPDAASRAQDVNDYTVVVVVAELYPDAGPVPAAWVRERRRWVQDVLFAPLTNPRTRLLAVPGEPGSGLWSVAPSAVETVYDVDELRERKVFLSVLRLTFREHADA